MWTAEGAQVEKNRVEEKQRLAKKERKKRKEEWEAEVKNI